MEQILLWFNLIAFTLMVGSFGSTFMFYGKSRVGWLRYYLLYLSGYAVFLMLLTYRYFSRLYLPEPILVLDRIVLILRSVIDIAFLWIIPKFIVTATPEETGRKTKAAMTAGSLSVLLIIAAAMITGNWYVNWLNKFSYNVYFGALSLLGLIRLRRSPSPSSSGIVRPFLYFSTALYSLLTILVILQLFLPHGGMNFRSNLLLGGVACFVWGGGSLVWLTLKTINRESSTDESLPREFIGRYGITDREGEIITLLLRGRSNQEVGDALFISHRTVESHLYNIYRKCEVRNKLELANLVTSAR